MRWLEEDGHFSALRSPSGYSNGNTFDCEGRQLSCEHGNRRVVRYEHDGSVTVIADKWQGKRLQRAQRYCGASRRRHLVLRSSGYGIRGDYEGFNAPSEVKPAVYRVDRKRAGWT